VVVEAEEPAEAAQDASAASSACRDEGSEASYEGEDEKVGAVAVVAAHGDGAWRIFPQAAELAARGHNSW